MLTTKQKYAATKLSQRIGSLTYGSTTQKRKAEILSNLGLL